MASDRPRRGERFSYDGVAVDPAAGEVRCTYSLDDRSFTEVIRVPAPAEAWRRPDVEDAVRLLFLIAGVSYYKTAAPAVIDTSDIALTDPERDFLHDLYVDGLGEFAFVNALDLTDLQIVGPTATAEPTVALAVVEPRPLVPFGGGIDSIVVAEQVRAQCPDTALFVVSTSGNRFAAIEDAAEVADLPVLRAERQLDEQVLRSNELGFLNGHVPVTAVLSAIAVLAAALDGRSAVVMSNEWSASAATRPWAGREVNHQWSKSLTFEQAFRAVLAGRVPSVDYFSALRPYSELWVAKRFAALDRYHLAFRSCNRAFTQDPARRLDDWCGKCDKCCFIDLILAPYLPASRLREIFGGSEPLDDDRLEPKFRSLLGDPAYVKPFECVGEESECRAAVLLAADRADRTTTVLLQRLAAEIRTAGPPYPDPDALQQPLGPAFIDPRYVDADIVV